VIHILKKVVLIILVIMLLKTNMVYSQTEYSTISASNKNYNSIKKKLRKENIQIVYEIPEIHMLQIKANSNKINEINELKYVNNDSQIIEIKEKTNSSLRDNLGVKRMLNSMFSNVSLFQYQWDMTNLHFKPTFDLHTSKTKIAIVDSGIDLMNKNLMSNVELTSKNLVPKYGFMGKEKNESGEITNIQDISGHGTFVTSQIASNKRIRGIAPYNPLLIYRTTTNGGGDPLWSMKGIVQAVNDGAKVINLSEGVYINNFEKSNNPIYLGFKKTVQYAKDNGAIVVMSAGNDNIKINYNENRNILDIPSNFENVITVASSNKNDKLSSFSNYGNNYIDILAPTGEGEDKILGYGLNNQILESNGNSYAAPKVTATLAKYIDYSGHESISKNQMLNDIGIEKEKNKYKNLDYSYTINKIE